MLSYLKGEGGRNIMTLESPVRFPIAGISQSLQAVALGGDQRHFGHGEQSVQQKQAKQQQNVHKQGAFVVMGLGF